MGEYAEDEEEGSTSTAEEVMLQNKCVSDLDSSQFASLFLAAVVSGSDSSNSSSPPLLLLFVGRSRRGAPWAGGGGGGGAFQRWQKPVYGRLPPPLSAYTHTQTLTHCHSLSA